MIIFSAQIRAARGILKISQAELAMITGLAIPTIKSLEGSDGAIEKANMSTINKIKDALEERGIKFVFTKGEDGKVSDIGIKTPLLPKE